MKGEKKKRYLLHERALLMKEYFRIQRNLFNSLKPKILYLQKKKKKKILRQKPLEHL